MYTTDLRGRQSQSMPTNLLTGKRNDEGEV
jgi:hypothetical protein